jgi:hypothetical protein
MWVDVNDYKQPKQLPNLPAWALPADESGRRGNGAPLKDEEPASANAARGDLRRFEAKIDGPLWLEVINVLPRRWQSRLQAPSNLASPRIVPSSSILPTVAWSKELRSNEATISDRIVRNLNQTLRGSIGRPWRMTLLEESLLALRSRRTRPELRGKVLTQDLAE